jgi:hypothetical protein
MAHFALTQDMNGRATFASTRINIGFQADNIALTNRGATLVEVSWDGVTVHDRLEPSSNRFLSGGDFQRSVVWLRSAAGGANPVDVVAVQE